MEFCICGHEKWQHWGDGTTWCALCRCNKFELDIEASKRYSSGAPIKLSEFTYTEGPMIEHRIIDESQKELIVSDINNPCGCAWLLRTGEQVAYCPAHVGDLRPATKSLPERIKEWREDDSQGFDGAIELLCEAEEELVRLNTPPSSDAGSPPKPTEESDANGRSLEGCSAIESKTETRAGARADAGRGGSSGSASAGRRGVRPGVAKAGESVRIEQGAGQSPELPVDAGSPQEPTCVFGTYCRRHGFVHGAEADELREALAKLKNPRVDAVMDKVDARDSLAWLELRQAASLPPGLPEARVGQQEARLTETCSLACVPARHYAPCPKAPQTEKPPHESRSPDGDGLGREDAGSSPAPKEPLRDSSVDLELPQDAANDAARLASATAPARQAGSEPADSPPLAPSGASLAPVEALKQKVERIVRGFEDEAMNGVICVPPAEEYMGVLWDAAPSRLWCKRCRDRWDALRTLPAELSALLPALQAAWASLVQENQHLKAENVRHWTGEWLVARKRDTEPWEVCWFDRYDHAALFFDDAQANWSTVFFCRVAHSEGHPLDLTPVLNSFKTRTEQAEAELTALRTQLTERSLQLCAEVEEHEATKALLSSQAHAQEQLRWREIVVDGFPLDGALVSVWRAWPGQIRDTKFLDLRMPGPSWEGLYGWEPTHWRPNLSPVEMRALLTQKEPTP